MVTTRMTEAVPITIPRPVRRERTGFARSAWALKLKASRRCMGLRLAAPYLVEELFGFRLGRIVGGQIQTHVLLEQVAGNIQISFALDVDLGAREDHLGTAGRQLLGFGEALVGFCVSPLFGEELGQIQQ